MFIHGLFCLPILTATLRKLFFIYWKYCCSGLYFQSLFCFVWPPRKQYKRRKHSFLSVRNRINNRINSEPVQFIIRWRNVMNEQWRNYRGWGIGGTCPPPPSRGMCPSGAPIQIFEKHRSLFEAAGYKMFKYWHVPHTKSGAPPSASWKCYPIVTPLWMSTAILSLTFA